MLPDRVSNPGPLTYESGALPIALRGPAVKIRFVGIGENKRISLSGVQERSFLYELRAYLIYVKVGEIQKRYEWLDDKTRAVCLNIGSDTDLL